MSRHFLFAVFFIFSSLLFAAPGTYTVDLSLSHDDLLMEMENVTVKTGESNVSWQANVESHGDAVALNVTKIEELGASPEGLARLRVHFEILNKKDNQRAIVAVETVENAPAFITYDNENLESYNIKFMASKKAL